jgi:hypothetical protein
LIVHSGEPDNNKMESDVQSATVKSRWSLYQQYGLAAALHELAENIATAIRSKTLHSETAS